MPRSLTGRFVLTTVAVALVAVIVTALVAFQLVRQQTLAQTRVVLRTSAQAVAVSPPAQRSAFADRIERRSGGRVDVAFGADGGTTGLVTSLPARLEARLDSSTRVSARVRDGFRTLLVEAVPARGGGSVIAVEDVSLLRGDTAVGQFLVALGIGVLVAVGLGVLVARLVTRPLRGIAGVAVRLARGERGVVGPPDAHAVVEVEEIRDALGALDTALARSEGRQREFLLSISHELRTPLTALRGYADALSDGLVPAADVPRIGGVLAVETERLDAFVRDLLALARLDADDFTIAHTDVRVGDVLDAVASAWAGTAAAVGATVRVLQSEGQVVARSDPGRVRQVVDGLVENALRVVPAGGGVVLQAVAGSDSVQIRVTDDGPGIGPDDLDRVFIRGALRDRYRDERPVGTGLGLSIASRLVTRLGGRIDVTSGPAGTTFVVRVPRASAV